MLSAENLLAKLGALDDIVLRKIAAAITDPDQIVALADEAETQSQDAAEDVDLADTKIGVALDLLEDIERRRSAYLDIIRSLSALSGEADQAALNEYRAKLEQLDKEQADAEKASKRAIPARDRAARHQQTLQTLTRFRDRWVFYDTNNPHAVAAGEGKLDKTMDPFDAADLLGITVEELEETGIDLNTTYFKSPDDPTLDPFKDAVDEVSTEDVIYLLLRRLPYERKRQMLQDLRVIVRIKHPWPKEERKQRGFTPISERVSVQLLATREEISTYQVGAQLAKPNTSV